VIDSLFKQQMDRFWDRTGHTAAALGLTPNGVTTLGFVLSGANALLFLLWHQSFWIFGLSIALIELLDNVDGAVARVTGASTRFGAFFDAWTDRYKDLFLLLPIAEVTGWWAVVLLAVTGGLLTSYGSARAAQATGELDADARAIADHGWPDLFERLERIATLCVGLVFTDLVPAAWLGGHSLLWVVLAFLAAMGHATAVQRFLRARRVLRHLDGREAG